ncbi:MAG: hypothetical protein M1819_006470 [Sarea resinae]|nr:MAG: hypothetical protein M1819_006470 [Sarea resinae]
MATKTLRVSRTCAPSRVCFHISRPVRTITTGTSSIHRQPSQLPTTTPPPDFLLPSYDHIFTAAQPHKLVRSNARTCLLRPSSHRRLFSASASTPRLLGALQNPRTDEEGNEMTVSITPRASHRLAEIAATEPEPPLLRITVESGGCHGFQYLMSLSPPSAVSPTDDTVFEAEDGTGARVVMDEPSLELLKGSKVDYTMELIGSQFKIVDNPLATSSCGCGTSFDVKA